VRKNLLLGLVLSTNVLAQTGADALLESTGDTADVATESSSAAAVVATTSRFKLTDHFLESLFVEWKSAGTQNFEINRWVGLILTHDFAAAAHLWSAMQPHITAQMRAPAAVAWAYLNWRLDLPQTFVHAWKSARAEAPNHRSWLALDQVLMKEQPAQWLLAKQPSIDSALAQQLCTAPLEGFALELAAWAMRHNPQHAHQILEQLPLGHPLALELAQTAVVQYARSNALGEAGKLLKRRIEPELKQIGDSKLLARHYLTLGRLLYQSGALEAAENFYARIPKGLPEFIPARTERTWALLRLGRVGELRGELESLNHQVLSDRFLPEVSLVRSISNLKLCRYDDVARDFKFFIDNNKVWANRISAALSSEDPAIDMTDARIAGLTTALQMREAEEAKLTVLTRESIQAALPAVGEQAHWTHARSQLVQTKQADKRSLLAQKQRFWKNRELVLTEAIRKMKFVKVEAMAQIRMAAIASGGDMVSNVQSASSGKLTYPFEGVYWPDELFHLHAAAQSRCSGGRP
jgi:tetratricopeptide (TPR) repeat protein